MSRTQFLHTAFTCAVAIAGGAAFHFLGLPVAWLSGSMLAVALLAMLEGPVHMPVMLRDFGLLTAGISLGSTVTPEAIATIQRYPLSLIGLTACVAATVATSTFLLQRWFGWDKGTAFLSSVPGALSAVMAMAVESRSDIRRIAVVQSIRLFTMVLVIPVALRAAGPTVVPATHATVSMPGLALTYVIALALGYGLLKIRMASALFIAGMLTGTVLHMANIVPGEVPEPLLICGMVLIGMFAGMRFAGTRFRDLIEMVLPGVLALAVALVFALIGAGIVYTITSLRPAEVLVAFAPGGAEAMIMMGAAMGLDTLYISTHHVLRAVGLNLVTPFFLPALRAQSRHQPDESARS